MVPACGTEAARMGGLNADRNGDDERESETGPAKKVTVLFRIPDVGRQRKQRCRGEAGEAGFW